MQKVILVAKTSRAGPSTCIPNVTARKCLTQRQSTRNHRPELCARSTPDVRMLGINSSV